MPIGPLDLLQLLHKRCLLTRAQPNVNISGKDSAARVRHMPKRGTSTCPPRRIELELFHILHRQQKGTTRLECWNATNVDVSVHPLIRDTQHFSCLFDRHISRNIWKIVNVCHKSSLVESKQPVN